MGRWIKRGRGRERHDSRCNLRLLACFRKWWGVMSDVSAKLENVARMDEGWRVQARKAARREERCARPCRKQNDRIGEAYCSARGNPRHPRAAACDCRVQGTEVMNCPNCHKRASLKEHYVLFDTFERAEVATWQCIYCGAICEPRGPSGHMVCTRIDRVILAPGELEQLRDVRSSNRKKPKDEHPKSVVNEGE